MGTQFAPDSTIGKYRIVRELGRGGMGVVYLAEDSVLGRSVALKVLHPQHSVDPGFAHRFQHEARVLGQFFHPNILPVNSFEAVDGVFLLEMPYLERGSLDSLLRSRGVYRSEMVQWTGDVLTALAHCHDRGLLHRDVKPTNVLLGDEGRALLSDFGLAKLANPDVSESLSSLTSTGLFVGTVRYAPPEAWDGAEPSPAWDLYSTGVLLYEGLTGRPVFEADTPLAYMKEVAERPVPPLRECQQGVSDELDSLVMSLLSKQPESRPSDAAAALESLRSTPEYQTDYDADTPTEHIRVTRPKRMYAAEGSRTRRSGDSTAWKARLSRRALPWVGWAVGCVMLLVAVFGGAALLRPNGTESGAPLPETPASSSLADVPPDRVPAWNALLGLTRSSSGRTRVYSAFTADATSPREWLWSEPEDDSGVAVLEIRDLGVSALRLREQGETSLSIDGHWGRYDSPAAMGVFEGTVTGQARWVERPNVLVARLEYRSESSGMRWQDEVVLAPDERTDVAVLVEAERTNLIMPLLHNELAERQPVWRTLTAQWFPALAPARADVPAMPAGSPEFAVDGLGADAVYATEIPGGQDAVMEGWPAVRKPTLRARWNKDGVLFLFEAQIPASVEPVFDVTILTQYAVPIGSSARCSARIEGEGIIDYSRWDWGATQIEEPAWQYTERHSGGDWCGEAFIPFAKAGIPCPHGEGVMWRLNAMLSSARQEGDDGELLAVWGAPKPADVFNGTVLTFRAAHD